MTAVNQRQFFRCPLETECPASVLIIGYRHYACQLKEMSLGGFAVVIPGELPAMKDPTARLRVGELEYIVRVTRQESRDEGVLVALEQVEEVLPNNTLIPSTPFTRCLTAAAWVTAIGIALVAIYCVSYEHLPKLTSL